VGNRRDLLQSAGWWSRVVELPCALLGVFYMCKAGGAAKACLSGVCRQMDCMRTHACSSVCVCVPLGRLGGWCELTGGSVGLWLLIDQIETFGLCRHSYADAWVESQGKAQLH
jgi:hypothetical protein